jgi:hypothetical protein
MIDPAHPAASWFLWILGAVFLLAFALPLLVAPLRWARVFRWRLPADTDLTEYFGRCLGGVATAVLWACVRAAPEPARHRLLFELLLGIAGTMCFVHVLGAVRRRQPWTETAEIALYAGAGVATYVIYRGLPA